MKPELKKQIEKARELNALKLSEFREGSLTAKIYASLDDTSALFKLVDFDERALYKRIHTTNKRLLQIKAETEKPKEQPQATAQPQTVTTTTATAQPVTVAQASKPDLKQFIPKKDGYISRRMLGTTDFKIVETAHKNSEFILLVGETGTGKTHLCRDLAFKKKLPYMRVNMNGATTPEDLIGQFIPNANPNNPNKYIWIDGVLTLFMKHGGVFVVDEINMTPADILSVLHSVTDDERKLVLTQKDGEVITAHKDFYLIATMNDNYEGTKPLNQALKDRFRVLTLDYSKAVEEKLKIDKKILKVADSLRNSEEIESAVSTRALLQYTKDKTLFSEKVARGFFIAKFDEQEQPVIKEVIEMILDGKQPEKPEQENEQEQDANAQNGTV